MADNMVAGLFGLTPEMYGEQQRISALNEGITLAQLSPSARGTAMIYGGAKGLGNAIGGLMGVEDPQMKIISARQQIIGRLDQTNPTSMLEGAKMLAQMGDQQGAFALADYARKAQSEIAQAQQRFAAGQASLAAAGRERVQADPEKVRLAKEVALLSGPVGSIEYNTAYAKSLKEQIEPKAEKDARFGTDRESVSAELYDKSFAQLTIAERAVVNKRVEEEQGKKAEKGAGKFTFPGQEKFADIPKFRSDVQKTIEKPLASIFSADQALQAIDDSIQTNNFVSFNAARVQLAKALGDSQLSKRDVEQAGGDPSLFGKLTDSTSVLFTGTPTLETQNLIKKTLQAVKKVSTNKANAEVEAQRKIAYSTKGYDKTLVDQALYFPELTAAQQGSIVSGDLAAQARALLKQRQEGAK